MSGNSIVARHFDVESRFILFRKFSIHFFFLRTRCKKLDCQLMHLSNSGKAPSRIQITHEAVYVEFLVPDTHS